MCPVAFDGNSIAPFVPSQRPGWGKREGGFFFGGGGSQVGSLGAGLSALQLQSDQGWVFPLVFTDTNSRVRS